MSNKIPTIQELLIKHEGLRLKPYKDGVGKITIGVGRNLDDVGISENEALIMLEIDIHKASVLAQKFTWFNLLSPQRQNVIISMIFNMGFTRFCGFEKMISAIQDHKYDDASSEMLKSKWASQVGSRAIELADMMRVG